MEQHDQSNRYSTKMIMGAAILLLSMALLAVVGKDAWTAKGLSAMQDVPLLGLSGFCDLYDTNGRDKGYIKFSGNFADVYDSNGSDKGYVKFDGTFSDIYDSNGNDKGYMKKSGSFADLYDSNGNDQGYIKASGGFGDVYTENGSDFGYVKCGGDEAFVAGAAARLLLG